MVCVPITVVLDTNMLTVPAQFGLDIFEEAERELERNVDFVVIEPVVWELEKKLEQLSGAVRQRFKVAMDLLKRCTINKMSDAVASLPVDQQILVFTKSINGVIATNDKGLIDQAIAEGIPVLFLRGKKRLRLRGTI